MTEAALLRLVLSLALVVLLLLALAWIARRSNWLRGAGHSGIRVLGMQSLGTRGAVAIVEVPEARLVLGVTTQQITLLHTLPPAAADTPPSVPAPLAPTSFGARLGAAMKRR